MTCSSTSFRVTTLCCGLPASLRVHHVRIVLSRRNVVHNLLSTWLFMTLPHQFRPPKELSMTYAAFRWNMFSSWHRETILNLRGRITTHKFDVDAREQLMKLALLEFAAKGITWQFIHRCRKKCAHVVLSTVGVRPREIARDMGGPPFFGSHCDKRKYPQERAHHVYRYTQKMCSHRRNIQSNVLLCVSHGRCITSARIHLGYEYNAGKRLKRDVSQI